MTEESRSVLLAPQQREKAQMQKTQKNAKRAPEGALFA
jgi:hypothetical protein